MTVCRTENLNAAKICTASTDAQGDHTGNTLEWYDVTEERKKDAEVNRLQRAVDQAQTALVMIDLDGAHIGNTLEWSDVTEDRRKAVEVARLQAAVDGASTPLLMIDRDFVINYSNASSVELLQKHEQVLQSLFPGFRVGQIIGTCIDTFRANPAHQRRLLGSRRRRRWSS